jgi:hypothetical protein
MIGGKFMSNHDAGYLLSLASTKIMEQYEKEKLDKDTAIEILQFNRKLVYYVDGNESEALDYLRRTHCGRCLRRMQPGEKLYLFSFWYMLKDLVELLESNATNTGKKYSDELASDRLCTECFDKIINDGTGILDAGQRERAHQEEKHYVYVVKERNQTD